MRSKTRAALGRRPTPHTLARGLFQGEVLNYRVPSATSEKFVLAIEGAPSMHRGRWADHHQLGDDED